MSVSMCSCNIVPVAASIYARGAGIGPAFAFLFGWPEANFVLFISIFSAGFYFMILILLQKLKLTDHSPLGPFLSLGAAAWLLFPDFFTSLLTWYVSLF